MSMEQFDKLSDYLFNYFHKKRNVNATMKIVDVWNRVKLFKLMTIEEGVQSYIDWKYIHRVKKIDKSN